MRNNVEWECGASSASAGDTALHIAQVISSVDILKGREVEISVVGHKSSFILLDQIGEIISRPIISNTWKNIKTYIRLMIFLIEFVLIIKVTDFTS